MTATEIGRTGPILGLAAFLCLVLSALNQTALAQDTRLKELKETSRMALQWWDSKAAIDPTGLFASDYRNYQEPIAAGQGETGITLDQLKSIVAANHAAFPGLEVEILLQIAEGNRVATHWTFSGEQNGPYQGLGPTGRFTSWSGISIDAYDDAGQIARTWVVWDKDTQFRELGLIK